MRIYLVGFMGAGKTRIGRALAARRGAPFVDLDAEIEASCGQSIATLFATRGETAFRDAEHACLRATEATDPVIVGTGGGTITFARNRALLRRLGVTVWLNPDFDLLVTRVGDGLGRAARPLFRNVDQARTLYRARLPAYRTADLRIDITTADSPTDIVDRINDLLREPSCAT
ncbi:MAG: shikimate kinase [Acidobacteriota bacterium]